MTGPSHNSWSPGTNPMTTGQPLPQPRQDDGPVPMTINGLSDAQRAAQAAVAAAQQKQPGALPAEFAQAYALVKDFRDKQVTYNAGVHADTSLSEDGKRERIAAFANSEAAKQIEVAEQLMNSVVAQDEAEVQRIRQSLSPPGDAAAEARKSRDWDAVKFALDTAQNDSSGTSTIQTALKAIESARTPEELAVRVERIPAYIESLGFDRNIAEKVIAQKVPQLAKAQARSEVDRRHAQTVRYDIDVAKRGLETGTPPKYLVNPADVKPG
jgi:hypothetical protein